MYQSYVQRRPYIIRRIVRCSYRLIIFLFHKIIIKYCAYSSKSIQRYVRCTCIQAANWCIQCMYTVQLCSKRGNEKWKKYKINNKFHFQPRQIFFDIIGLLAFTSSPHTVQMGFRNFCAPSFFLLFGTQ